MKIMAKEKLQNYPELIDADLDFAATREHFGTGSCNYAVSEKILANGQVVVYLHHQREGEQAVDTPIGFRRVCEQGIIVCGYKVKPRILGFLRMPKIRIVPDAEREAVESELLQKFGDKKPAFMDFWDSDE